MMKKKDQNAISIFVSDSTSSALKPHGKQYIFKFSIK